MELMNICMEIAGIKNGLEKGDIRFQYGILAATMKPGHPSELLGEILEPVGGRAFKGQPVDLRMVKEFRDSLQTFGDAFSVDLGRQLEELDAYIEAHLKR